MDNFTFDGMGIAVYLYLGTNNTSQAFSAGKPIGPKLLGMVFTNETLTVSLPPGDSLDGYHAISVWCVPAHANFGSGTFQPHISSIHAESGVASLSVSGAAGQVYQLQSSTNGFDWTDLILETNTAGTVDFIDSNALPADLYRVQVQ
jgi:hypothetical protein